MPAEPNPLDVILFKVGELEDRVEKLEKSSSGPPADQSEADRFLDRWAPITLDEFRAKYGIDHGKPIPGMTAYDENEVIYRARAFYSTQGFPTRRSSTPNLVLEAVEVIAHADAQTAPTKYECGGPKAPFCYPDTLAYAFYVGLVDTQAEYQASLGSGKQPGSLAGVTLESLLKPNFQGGGPSGG